MPYGFIYKEHFVINLLNFLFSVSEIHMKTPFVSSYISITHTLTKLQCYSYVSLSSSYRFVLKIFIQWRA